MKTISYLMIAFALLSFTQIANAQDDYDFYLQKARQRLADGDCTRAEISYNSYKDMAHKTDKEIERLIELCKSVGAMDANTINDQHSGYEKNRNGLYYQFFRRNNGDLPKIGDLLEVNLSCVVNDTTSIIPPTNNVMMLKAPGFPGDINEGLVMMHRGDSASFIVNIDSTFKYLFDQPTLPTEFNPTDVMRFEVRMKDFYPEKVFAKKFANDVRKRNAERIAQLKKDYPEETAIADDELADFLAMNGVFAKPTASGLYYVVTEVGNGEKPEVGKTVTTHYTGRLLDGTVFDSSVERGEPFKFILGVGQVIAGWDEGVQLMSKGEKGVLYIPYYLGYGDRQAGDKIMPFSNLIFEIELLDFETFEKE